MALPFQSVVSIEEPCLDHSGNFPEQMGNIDLLIPVGYSLSGRSEMLFAKAPEQGSGSLPLVASSDYQQP